MDGQGGDKVSFCVKNTPFPLSILVTQATSAQRALLIFPIHCFFLSQVTTFTGIKLRCSFGSELTDERQD